MPAAAAHASGSYPRERLGTKLHINLTNKLQALRPTFKALLEPQTINQRNGGMQQSEQKRNLVHR
jgi:hypothetical protein